MTRRLHTIYEPVVKRAWAAVRAASGYTETERRAAAEAVKTLWALPPGERVAWAREDWRLLTFEGWRLLLARAGSSAPEEASLAARLALKAAAHLDAGRYGRALVADCVAAAAAALARARLAAADPAAALTALALAQMHLAEGTGDPYVGVEVLRARAAFEQAEGGGQSALRLLGRARCLAQDLADPELERRVRAEEEALRARLGSPGPW